MVSQNRAAFYHVNLAILMLSNIVSTNRFYCATQICIARTCYGDVAGWLGGWLAVRHTPVLYHKG